MTGPGQARIVNWCCLLAVSGAAAAQNTSQPVNVPLGDADRVAITAMLVERHPEIASSPGLKSSYYNEGGATDECGMEERHVSRSDRKGVEIRMEPRGDCDTDFAGLYFLPHSQRLGRGTAARVNCSRPTITRTASGAATPLWACHKVQFREYVQLDGQVCEVRLSGNMTTPTLVAAKAAGLDAIGAAGKPLPEALVVYSANEGADDWATFGTNDCMPGISVRFSSTESSDPEDPASWKAIVMAQ